MPDKTTPANLPASHNSVRVYGCVWEEN